jgi:hypothetical protein
VRFGITKRHSRRWRELFAVLMACALMLLASCNDAEPASDISVSPFYAASSFWNTPIPANPPIDPNSALMVAKALAAVASQAVFSNSNDWGMPLAYASASSKPYTIQCTLDCPGNTITFPIPAGALPALGSDHHLVVINGDQELDMWEASHNAANDTWSAATRVINQLNGSGSTCPQGQHCNGAVAAGWAAMGGVIRPEEIAQGHINHALALFLPLTKAGYIACPATHTDGVSSDPAAIPEGARVQLDPAFNVDAQPWPAWQKSIAKALQNYGAYVTDTSGVLGLRGQADQNPGSLTWAAAGVSNNAPSLSNFPWTRMRVLQIQSCN